MSVSADAQTKYLLSTVTASPSDKGLPSCVISTIHADRDKDHVIPEGMDATNFLKAPVLMWSHGGSDRYAALPIGTVTALNVTPGQGITAEWRWLENDPMADRVRNAWEQGVVRGTSIGFRPTKMEPNAEGGVDHLAWELLELSVCPIPANPEAVRTLKTLGLMDDPAEPEPIAASDSDTAPTILMPGERVLTASQNRALAHGLVVAETDEIKAELATLRAEFEAVQKRGRVLSAVNESRLRAAMDALANAGGVLTEVLAQLMPMEEPEDEEHPKPKPMRPMDEAATYSLRLAEDDSAAPVLRLLLAEDDTGVVTLVDDGGREPTFAIDPAVMRSVVAEAVREHLHAALVEPIGDSIRRALDAARGRVQ